MKSNFLMTGLWGMEMQMNKDQETDWLKIIDEKSTRKTHAKNASHFFN